MQLLPFKLEDFFDQYEHRSDLINLASSDAQPWTQSELESRLGSPVAAPRSSLGYPDPRALLIPALERALGAPRGGSALPTLGATEGIALVMHLLVARDRVNSVALPEPAYGAFHGWAKLLDLEVQSYTYAPERNWGPAPDELRRLAGTCDSLVVINPQNPVGHVLSQSQLRELALILADHGGTLVVDEVFAAPDASESLAYFADNVMVIGSLSKMYGLPGLRLGWVLADRRRIEVLRTLQQYLTLRHQCSPLRSVTFYSIA